MADTAPRVAIVTGSESGIGRATAVALAEQGFDLGITWSISTAPSSACSAPARRMVDGGMLQMGPMAGSHLKSDDWRRP